MRRFFRFAFPLAVLLVPLAVLARTGGGEHYVSPSSDDYGGDHDGGGGDGIGFLFRILIELAFRYPKVGVPLLIVAVAGYVMVQKNTNPTTRTQRAFQRLEAQSFAGDTQSGATQLSHWVSQLRSRDAAFDVDGLYTRARLLFVKVQEAWFERDLTPVRPLLSDATFQRLTTQLELMHRQGVRDAICDIRVEDVRLIAVEQNDAYDTVHLRIQASMRDTDVPADASDEAALQAARSARAESFVEVWSFVRKPGAQTKIGEDVTQGKCPNCGAPFNGGATNTCEYCKAVVNSGNYDWVLAEITQASEYQPFVSQTPGLNDLRRVDPAFTVEAIEDRASLIFWRWISAHSANEAGALAKLALPSYQQTLQAELDGLKQQKRRRTFLECAVGGVNTRSVAVNDNGRDECSVEIRWSARMAVLGEGQRASNVPAINQRSVFVLTRKAGAQTKAGNGMSTSRCPSCNAPLTDTLTPVCDYCGAELSHGDLDWVLLDAMTYEAWSAREWSKKQAPRAAPAPRAAGGQDRVMDLGERTRILSMMAAVAASDGTVDARERQLLQLCAKRWSVPWETVEFALQNGEAMFDGLVPRGSPQAEIFLKAIVDMALIDGRIDRKERKLLEDAAAHLGVPDKLNALITR